MEVVTPLKLKEWEEGLLTHPDKKCVGYVCEGIRDVFRIGFNYTTSICRSATGNMKSVQEHKEVVEAYVVGRGRLVE